MTFSYQGINWYTPGPHSPHQIWDKISTVCPEYADRLASGHRADTSGYQQVSAVLDYLDAAKAITHALFYALDPVPRDDEIDEVEAQINAIYQRSELIRVSLQAGIKTPTPPPPLPRHVEYFRQKCEVLKARKPPADDN